MCYCYGLFDLSLLFHFRDQIPCLIGNQVAFQVFFMGQRTGRVMMEELQKQNVYSTDLDIGSHPLWQPEII